MEFAAHIFKAYDIRGLADTELSTDLAYRLGRAFVAYLRAQGTNLVDKKLVVGRDMRPTSPAFQQAVMEGIRHEGVSVVDIGMTSTPLFNFTCSQFPEHAGGVMVTASHNPAEYNGFKLTLGNALPVPGKVMREWVHKVTIESKLSASTTSFNPLPAYLDKLFSLVPSESLKSQKIVIDFGNGMGIVTFRKLLERLPQVQAEFLYADPDGRFPNHEANPLKTETLYNLQQAVVQHKADFGFALDGDCDRIGLVDEKGMVVDPSSVGVLIGQEVLALHPGGLVLKDPRTSMIIDDIFQSLGSKIEMCPVGHANIKKQMQQTGAVFACELSLHLYYSDLRNIESSDLSLLYILRLLSRQSRPLSELVAPLKKYFHSGEINFEIEHKDEVLQVIEEKYKPTAKEISHLDGLWMRFDWGWLSVRASNTEPVLRLNLEAKTKEVMEEKVTEVSSMVSNQREAEVVM